MKLRKEIEVIEQTLINTREKYRALKEYAKADEIKNILSKEYCYEIKDTLPKASYQRTLVKAKHIDWEYEILKQLNIYNVVEKSFPNNSKIFIENFDYILRKFIEDVVVDYMARNNMRVIVNETPNKNNL